MFVLMTRCEAEIFSMLRGAYPAATLFVQHMMDMDNYYPGRSWYPFVTEQLPRMRELTGSSGVHLLTFVRLTRSVKSGRRYLTWHYGVARVSSSTHLMDTEQAEIRIPSCVNVSKSSLHTGWRAICQCSRTVRPLGLKPTHTVEGSRIQYIGSLCSGPTEHCGCVLRTLAAARYGSAGRTTRKASGTDRR